MSDKPLMEPVQRHWRWQMAVLAVGAATHALVILAVPLFQLPDSVWYVQIGVDIAEDLRFDNPLILQRPLGYPLFLALIFSLFGQTSSIAIQIAQHLMTLTVGFLTMMIVTELSRSRTLMVLAGLGTVTSFGLIGYANIVLTETCYTLAIWVGNEWPRRRPCLAMTSNGRCNNCASRWEVKNASWR